jgi:uncharacterized protein YraI
MKAPACLRLLLGGSLLTLSLAVNAQNAVTTDSAGVYAGPDSSYPEVTQLDANTPIQVMGCLDDWSWCDVALQDTRGWMYSPDITYQYEGGYVPLYSYAPALGIAVVAFSVDSYWGSYYRGRPWYGQRDQWVHRTVNHRRPSGPPPSRSLPSHEVVRADRPHPVARPEQSMRLTAAEQSRRDADRAHQDSQRQDPQRHDTAAEHKAGTSEPRPQEHVAPSPQLTERNARPPEQAAPPRGDQRPAHPAERTDAPRSEEHHTAAPAKPQSQPPKEDQGDHPR